MTDAVETIALYVCTHKRNGPLERLLSSVDEAAKRIQPEVAVGVVVVDDNPDGRAKAVVDDFEHHFIGGLHYRFSGAQNISTARNTGVKAALELGDWVAMTDDDQVVSPEWFESLLATQRRTNADAVTGPVILRYEDGAPRWLTDQPFGELLEAPLQNEGDAVDTCSTGNSMVRSAFLCANRGIRFRTELGTLGGEDMVFFRSAIAAGLAAHYSREAVCWAEQPVERSTFRHTIRTAFWLGNSEFITNHERGEATRTRLLLRSASRAARAIRRPMARLASREAPQLRYTIADAARALGLAAGTLGMKVSHR